MIELPGPIESNERVRPVKLTTNCVLPHKEGEHVIVIGRGATESNVTNFSHIWDKRIRYAEFEIMSTGQCMTETEYSYDLTDPMSIICFHSKEGRAAFRGDSGMLLGGFFRLGKFFLILSKNIRWSIGSSKRRRFTWNGEHGYLRRGTKNHPKPSYIHIRAILLRLDIEDHWFGVAKMQLATPSVCRSTGVLVPSSLLTPVGSLLNLTSVELLKISYLESG